MGISSSHQRTGHHSLPSPCWPDCQRCQCGWALGISRYHSTDHPAIPCCVCAASSDRAELVTAGAPTASSAAIRAGPIWEKSNGGGFELTCIVLSYLHSSCLARPYQRVGHTHSGLARAAASRSQCMPDHRSHRELSTRCARPDVMLQRAVECIERRATPISMWHIFVSWAQPWRVEYHSNSSTQ